LWLAVLLLAGCATPQNYRLFQTFDQNDQRVDGVTPISEAVYQSDLAFEWKIQKGDRVEVQLQTQPLSDYSPVGNVQAQEREPRSIGRTGTSGTGVDGLLVAADGSIRLPLIGNVSVLGLTENQAAEQINQAYKQYYRRAHVHVRILNHKVFVLGEVKGTQVNPIPMTSSGMTLIEAIARAGDITDYADRANIKIIRNDLRNPVIRNVDLTRIENIAQVSMLLQPNDIIYVPPLDSKAYNVTFNERVPPFFGMIHSILTPFLDIKTLTDSNGGTIRVLP